MERACPNRRRLLVLGLSLAMGLGCAHTTVEGEADAEPVSAVEEGAAAPLSSGSPESPPAWDPPRPDAYEQCRIEGEQPAEACRDQWSYFFLRVLNQHHLSIPASLSFNPAVNRVLANEDGFSGLLRPGTYRVTIESPGYEPTDVTFEVGADEKALLDIELMELRAETPEERE